MTSMKIAVVIPVFNRLESSLRAVQSVLLQSDFEVELIVVDDGSTIDLSELQRLVEGAGGCFFRIEHGGVSRARNFGVSQTNARWISFLDSDDEWMPQKLSKQLHFLKGNSEARVVHCEEIWIRNARRVNSKNIHQKCSGEAFARCLEICCISPSAVLLDRQLFCELGGFDENMRVCEDYDLWIRLSAREPVYLIDEQLVIKYGGHADQLSRSQLAMDRFRVYSLLKNLGDLALNEEQERLVRKQIAIKSAILKTGAVKHNNIAAKILYHDVLATIERCGDLQSCLERIKLDITHGGGYEKSCS